MRKSGMKKEIECSIADEVWLPVLGYEGYYEVSSTGRVRSLSRIELSGGVKRKRHGRIMSPSKQRNGYMRIELSKDGFRKKYSIHRLVAMAFCISKNKDACQINHIDFNRENNHKDNLELVTAQENMDHSKNAFRMGPILSPAVAKKLTEDDVINIRKIRRDGVILKDISKMYGVSVTTVSNIVKGRTWKYAD